MWTCQFLNIFQLLSSVCFINLTHSHNTILIDSHLLHVEKGCPPNSKITRFVAIPYRQGHKTDSIHIRNFPLSFWRIALNYDSSTQRNIMQTSKTNTACLTRIQATNGTWSHMSQFYCVMSCERHGSKCWFRCFLLSFTKTRSTIAGYFQLLDHPNNNNDPFLNWGNPSHMKKSSTCHFVRSRKWNCRSFLQL